MANTDTPSATSETNKSQTEDHVLAASEHLGATDYESGRSYAYTCDEMPDHVYLVTREDMSDLGSALSSGVEDAYSLWCAETTPQSTTIDQVRSSALGDDTNLSVLRDEAGNAGDTLTVAAIDLLDH